MELVASAVPVTKPMSSSTVEAPDFLDSRMILETSFDEPDGVLPRVAASLISCTSELLKFIFSALACKNSATTAILPKSVIAQKEKHAAPLFETSDTSGLLVALGSLSESARPFAPSRTEPLSSCPFCVRRCVAESEAICA